MARSTKVGNLTPDDIDLVAVLKVIQKAKETKIHTQRDEIVMGLAEKKDE